MQCLFSTSFSLILDIVFPFLQTLYSLFENKRKWTPLIPISSGLGSHHQYSSSSVSHSPIAIVLCQLGYTGDNITWSDQNTALWSLNSSLIIVPRDEAWWPGVMDRSLLFRTLMGTSCSETLRQPVAQMECFHFLMCYRAGNTPSRSLKFYNYTFSCLKAPSTFTVC